MWTSSSSGNPNLFKMYFRLRVLSYWEYTTKQNNNNKIVSSRYLLEEDYSTKK